MGMSRRCGVLLGCVLGVFGAMLPVVRAEEAQEAVAVGTGGASFEALGTKQCPSGWTAAYTGLVVFPCYELVSSPVTSTQETKSSPVAVGGFRCMAGQTFNLGQGYHACLLLNPTGGYKECAVCVK